MQPEGWCVKVRIRVKAVMKDFLKVVVLAGVVAMASVSQATTNTWDGGGGDDYWQTDANWVGDAKPSANDVLVFSGTTRTSTSNDFPANTQFDGIQFPNTAEGQEFSLAGNGINLLGDITNSAAVTNITDTIALDMQIISGNSTFHLDTNHNLSVSGSISDDTGGRYVYQLGPGSLMLTASNSLSTLSIGRLFYLDGGGRLTVNGGSVIISDDHALGNDGFRLEGGGTLSLAADGMTIPNGIFFPNWGGSEKILELDLAGTNSGTFAGNIDYRFGDGSAIKYNVGSQDTLILSGNGYSGAGAAGFTKVGPGTLIITGTNTYKNRTAINEGTLQLGDGGAMGTLPGIRAIVNNSALFFNGTNTLTQGIDLGWPISGSGELRHINSTGTVVLAAANEYTGATRFGSHGLNRLGGTLRLMHNSALGTSGVVYERGGTIELGTNGLTIANGVSIYNWGGGVRTHRLDLEGTNSATMSGNMDIRYTAGRGFVTDVGADDTLTYSGKLYSGGGGNAGVTKAGAGTLILTASNTYWAATQIDAGTLQVNNATGSATGSGGVNVNDGGTLGGTGSVAGAASVADGGQLAAGAGGAGTLTLAGGLTLNDGAGLSIALDQDGPVGQIEVTGGTFTGASAGSVDINIDMQALPPQDAYTIMDWSDATAVGVESGDFVIAEPYSNAFQIRVVGKSLVLARGSTIFVIR
jgi:fibronectin-binding autotransporter adhesin